MYPPFKYTTAPSTIVQFVRFNPKNNSQEIRSAITVNDAGPHNGYNNSSFHPRPIVFEDPGNPRQSIINNVIEGVQQVLNLAEDPIIIPTFPQVSKDSILRILEELPKVNLAKNPDGLFQWNFGDYVRRFLRKLESERMLQLDFLRYRSADHFYELHLKVYCEPIRPGYYY